jgi:hypothetical protein
MNDNRPRPATGGFPYFAPSSAPAAGDSPPIAENDNATPPQPSGGGPAARQPAARQAAGSGTGAADARRVGKAKPIAAAAPSSSRAKIACPAPPIPQGGDRWAPRPKVDPLKAPPAIGWQAARALQRQRKQSTRSPSSFSIGGKLNKRAAEEAAEAQRRQNCPIERAMLTLRSRGRRVVYRMSVHGGDAELFFISGLGRDRTADELLELAAKVAA